ncbi:MAG: DNA repair protein RadC [Candidatus Pacebacteria bacterium]|jgi:DNA repair protein RadC|nr:DNA repair protein RadC [Candidatus Paceibacterota bacterium]MBT3512006.1 DNA repair protein RadC [Candidatus Paceibacterota bacterium]MBT4004858.1 DNA repair protein RadC [Candidatus Paceibacterota bacterium]MBT4359037.1 DNA repair protein RadC [Candidatus Paceibacterota bacterium]MBT4680524.1 DNA repair protein RadC [Candidatus Paceibacterota bacterium]
MIQPIQNLPKSKRPRERLISTGPQNLTQPELLAVVLGSGTNKRNVLALAKQILNKFGSSLSTITLKQLTTVHGIGQIQAAKIIATLELGKRLHNLKPKPRLLKPTDALREVSEIRPSHREQLIGLYLNARYELMAKEVLAVGSVNAHSIEPRDVFAPAIKLPCRSLILVHNHPSGDPQPSQDDISTSLKLKKAGRLLGISLLDHLIVTKDSHLSMQQQKLI